MRFVAAVAQEPVAHIRRCFGEHPENRGSHPHGQGESYDAQPHRQMLGRMRRVTPINPRAKMRAVGTVTCQHEAGIKVRSGQ